MKIIYIVLIIVLVFGMIYFLWNSKINKFNGGSYRYKMFSDKIVKMDDVFKNEIVMELNEFFDNIGLDFYTITTINNENIKTIYQKNFDKELFKKTIENLSELNYILLTDETLEKNMIKNYTKTEAIKRERKIKVQALKHNYISSIYSERINVKLIPKNTIYLQNLLKSLSFIYVSSEDSYGTISDLFSIATDYNAPYIHIEDNHDPKYSDNDLCNEIYRFFRRSFENEDILTNVVYYLIKNNFKYLRKDDNFRSIVNIISEQFNLDVLKDILYIIIQQSDFTLKNFGISFKNINDINLTIKQEYDELHNKYSSELKSITSFENINDEFMMYAMTNVICNPFDQNRLLLDYLKFNQNHMMYEIKDPFLFEHMFRDKFIDLIKPFLVQLIYQFVILLIIDILAFYNDFENVKYLEETFHEHTIKRLNFNDNQILRTVGRLTYPLSQNIYQNNVDQFNSISKNYEFQDLSVDIRIRLDLSNRTLFTKYVSKNINYTFDDINNILNNRIDQYKNDNIAKLVGQYPTDVFYTYIYFEFMHTYEDCIHYIPKNTMYSVFNFEDLICSINDLTFYLLLFEVIYEKNKNEDLLKIINLFKRNIIKKLDNIKDDFNEIENDIIEMFDLVKKIGATFNTEIFKPDNKDYLVMYILYMYFGEKTLVLTQKPHLLIDSLMILKKDIERAFNRNDLTQNVRYNLFTFDNKQKIYNISKYVTKIITFEMNVMAYYKMFMYPFLDNEKERINFSHQNTFKTLFVFNGGNAHGLCYQQMLLDVYN